MSKFNSIVSCAWLKDNLLESKLLLIDCRFRLAEPNWGYEEYLKSHIPGAHYLDLNKDLSEKMSTHGGRHPLPKGLPTNKITNK